MAGELALAMRRVVKLLSPLTKKAERNAERFSDVVLSARILERVGLYGAAGRKKSALRGGKTLLEAYRTSWRRERTESWSPGGKKGEFSRSDNVIQTLEGLC